MPGSSSRSGGPSVETERVIGGRLQSAYPAGRHDVELRVEGVHGTELTEVLALEGSKILVNEPRCRKVVFAAPQGDLATIAAAEAAGYRYVVDVDVPAPGRSSGGSSVETLELSLLVLEPEFVTKLDAGLDALGEHLG